MQAFLTRSYRFQFLNIKIGEGEFMKKILVLDDNQDILDIVEEVLNYEHFSVCSISESTNFLEIALNYLPDLVLLDYRLDESNGAELCQRIKSHSKLKHIPVIMFSAYLLKDEDFQEFGCDGVICKPFDIAALVAKINNLLKPDLV